jgi:hypothetical protein
MKKLLSDMFIMMSNVTSIALVLTLYEGKILPVIWYKLH